MDNTAREYRQRAVACLRLANESREAYVKVALTELASKFRSLANSRRHLRHRSAPGEIGLVLRSDPS